MRDPTIRLKTIIRIAVEALEDIGPYGTQIDMKSVMKLAYDTAERCKKMLDEWEKEQAGIPLPVPGEPPWVTRKG